MSTLILHLPLGPHHAATEYRYTLSADGQQVQRHGTAPASTLPAPARAGETVALAPVHAFSWQRVALPPGVGPGSPRLRNVLEGLLEDRLLDEPSALHFALEPDARAGHSAWVAVCDRAWLQAHLQALEAAGHPVARIVPELAPGSSPALYVLGRSAADAVLARTQGPEHGIVLLPLAAAPLALGDIDPEDPPPVFAEAAVAALVEQALGLSVHLQTAHERALQAAQGPWDLAQLDLERSPRTRALRRLSQLADKLLRAPQWRPVRWGLAACLLVQLIGLNAWAWQERNALAAKQAAVRNLLTQTFPQVKVVVDAPLQMEREVTRLRQAAGGLAPRDLEVMLSTTAQALPPGPPPSGMDYSPGELRLSGLALAPDALEPAQQRLRASQYTLHSEADKLTVRSAPSP